MRSINKPATLVSAASEQNMPSIAVTDYCTLAGIYDSYQASLKTKTKLIVGCHLNFTDDRTPVFDFINNPENKKPEIDRRSLILLATNATGYKNLLNMNFEAEKCKLEKASKIDKVSLVDWDILKKYNEGIICLTGDSNGIVSQDFLKYGKDCAVKTAKRLKDIFGDRFGLELQPHTTRGRGADQFAANRFLLKLSNELDIRPVATSNCLHIKKEHVKHQDFLTAIKYHRAYYDGSRQKFVKPDFYLHKGEEIVKFFSRNFGNTFATSLCENSIYFSDLCEEAKWTSPEFVTGDKAQLPIFPVKDEAEYDAFNRWVRDQPDLQHLDEDKQYMRYWCESNLHKIPNKEEYKKRYEQELSVYEQLGFSSYMLITADFVRWSRDNGVRVGPGRGCLDGATLVLSDEGFIRLDSITTNNKVYTHTGQLQNVINCFEYDVDEDLLEIKTHNSFNSLVLTKDHKIFAAKAQLTDKYINYLNKNNTLKIKKYIDFDTPKWIKASDLSVGDRVYTSLPKRNIDNTNVFPNIKLHVDFSKYSSCNTKEVLVPFDSDFMYFLGRFTGDGWLSKVSKKRDTYDVGLAFHSSDTKSINRFKNYLEKFGLFVSERKHKSKNLIQLIVSNKSLYIALKSIFLEYKYTSKTKHLPVFFRSLKNHMLINIIFGLIDSDGSFDKKNIDNRISIDSTSKRLICEVKESLLYLGICSSIITRAKHYKDKYLCNESYKLRFNKKQLFNPKNNGYYSVISSISNTKTNKVYDIKVENDFSYLTINGIVHNSVGGSLIGYLLDIHKADPIEHGLIFERFLNLEKREWPDIDLDFDSVGREKVLEYITHKYGSEYVAHVSNFVSFTPKNAITDVISCLEIGGDRSEAFKIAKNITETIPTECRTVKSAADKSPLFKEFLIEYPDVEEFAEMLIGLPRSYSTHAAGVVVGKYPLAGLVPLRYDDYGVVALEFEKTRTEKNGLVKIDFLGLETLNIIDATMKIIDDLNESPPEDPPDYNYYYENVYNMISEGDTFGVFQLGTSGGTIDLCRKIQPKNLEDLAVINALTRPGVPPAVRQSYIERRFGREEIKIPHPNLNRAVAKTMGYCVFEESFLWLAHDFCGWNLLRADKMRKISKLKAKGKHLLEELHEGYLLGAIEHSKVDEEFAEHIWNDWVIPLSGYAFNKSHAILYSMTSLHTAYLKALYPAAFMTANLMSETKSNAPQSKTNKLKIKYDMRKMGITILPPHINKANLTYKLIDNKHLVTGFLALRGVKDPAAQDLINKQPFSSFEDFLFRVDSSKVRASVVEALISVGALDDFGHTRKSMFLYSSDLRKKLKVWKNRGKEEKFEFELPTEEWTIGELRGLELKYLGEAILGNKKDSYPTLFSNRGITPVCDTKNLSDRTRVVIEGEVTDLFVFKVKNEKSKIFGQEVCRMIVEDLKGDQVPVVAFPSALEEFKKKYDKAVGSITKISPGFGIRFSATTNWYNKELSLVAQEIYDVVAPISGPKDMEKKKVEIYSGKAKRKNSKKKSEDITNDLLDLISIDDE